ncbi:DUF305 domain-containing protein [Polymorphospora rubra]|uniref:DUF305 domain-containing protein n=1 Tax=Polymorphospora rubra TaxID=338584 RepID=UPI001BB4316F|nr:DUF305 domain-containing protein [Polymorphospora rubra]
MTPPVVPRRAVLAGLAVTVTVVLAGCGRGGEYSSGTDHGAAATVPAGAAAGTTTTFNDADVTFAQTMVPHHRQAVEMAVLAQTRAENTDVKALADRIRDTQQSEIDTMTGWLAAWGRPAPMPGAGHGTSPPGTAHPMPGMLSDADMKSLADARGTAFDQQFLTMMIAHHQGAVTMAREEIAKGSNADAKALAERIVTEQQAEITAMRDILSRL